jgi:hypothetical protein
LEYAQPEKEVQAVQSPSKVKGAKKRNNQKGIEKGNNSIMSLSSLVWKYICVEIPAF